MQLKYESLESPVTKADVVAYQQVYGGTKWPGIFKAMAALTGMFFIVSALSIAQQNTVYISWTGLTGFAAAAFLVTLLVDIGFLFFFLFSYFMIRRFAKMYRFALLNNMRFYVTASGLNYPGMIFDNGHSGVIGPAYVLPSGMEMGNYRYVTGSGRNQQTHNYGYVRVKLSRKLPHMVLDSKANNMFGFFSGLGDWFDKSQKLQLEGGFNKYFNLYVPKQYERDALYVFTPDVMQAVIQYGANYDMEIVDDELYIYKLGKFDLLSRETIASMVAIVDALSLEFTKQTHRYSDDRVAEARASNIVGEQGQRLKQGSGLAAIGVILYVLYLFGEPLFNLIPDDVQLIFQTFAAPAVIVIVIISVILAIKRRGGIS